MCALGTQKANAPKGGVRTHVRSNTKIPNPKARRPNVQLHVARVQLHIACMHVKMQGRAGGREVYGWMERVTSRERRVRKRGSEKNNVHLHIWYVQLQSVMNPKPQTRIPYP